MSASNARDSLFAKPLGSVADFRFDQSVVDVFPDMLQRSIPGYQSIIAQTGLLAARFAQPHTRLYDLGCSLGATSLSMQASLGESRLHNGSSVGCEIIGIDNSTDMLERCRAVIDLANLQPQSQSQHFPPAAGPDTNGQSQPQKSTLGWQTDATPSLVQKVPIVPITLREADIQDVAIDNASVVALNFTLQFVPVADRDALMQRIANGLVSGGALVLSEKVTFSDPLVAELHIAMYHAFKAANGYSELEISQKRTALEHVLVPDTLETHANRLARAGFNSSSVWFQCFNFASIIAIKL